MSEFKEYGEHTVTVEVDFTKPKDEVVTQHTWDFTDPNSQFDFDCKYHFESISIYDINERKGVRSFYHNDKATVFCSDDPIALAAAVEEHLAICNS